jgi:hypothetical protein
VTVHRRGVGEVFVVVGRPPACWQVWSRMQYRRSQKEIISYLIVLHSVGDIVSLMFTHPMLSFKYCMVASNALYTTVHYTLLYTFNCYVHEGFLYIYTQVYCKRSTMAIFAYMSSPHACPSSSPPDKSELSSELSSLSPLTWKTNYRPASRRPSRIINCCSMFLTCWYLRCQYFGLPV